MATKTFIFRGDTGKAYTVDVESLDGQTSIQTGITTTEIGTGTYTSSITSTVASTLTTYVTKINLGGSLVAYFGADLKEVAGTYYAQEMPTALMNATASADTITVAIDGLAASITVVSPLSSDGTRLELVQGDSYSTVNGRTLTFNITGQTGLIGSVAHLRLEHSTDDLATSATISSGTQAVTFSDITTTQTAALIEGNHKYQIRFIEGSDKATPIQGVCVVKKGL